MIKENVKALIVIIIVICSSWAHAISQVGPKAIGSGVEGFHLLLPFNYSTFFQLNEQDLKVDERHLGLNHTKSNSYFFVPFSKFSKNEFYNKNDVIDFFEEEGWFEILTDDCRLSYIQTTKNSIKAVSTWGQNKGVAVIGSRSKWVQRHIITMMQDLKLKSGDCIWR